MPDQAEDVPEGASEPSTQDILGWILQIVWNVCYPIGLGIYYFFYYICFGAVFVIRLLYQPLAFIFLPIVYLVQFLWQCFLAPFRFIAKFETIYIYLGIAALVGLTGGLIVSFIYGFLQGPLGLNAKPCRTVKEYREEKHKKKAKAEPQLISSGYSSPNYANLSDGMRTGARGKGLVAQTIMEEMDSDY